jgi:bifunctional non-homologous end joining protein LigD
VKDEAVTTWVKPALVAEVKFTEWTSSGEMRHPVYLGLREDKQAGDVVREQEKAPEGRCT